MIDIIAHRGVWHEVCEKNTEAGFRTALANGFGIETDIRDWNGELVISHDIPNGGNLTFKEFIKIVCEYSPQTLALNIKADGLQNIIKKELEQYSNYFCFDMSIPDSLAYIKSGLVYYTRFSDVELNTCLFDEAKGIWQDNFRSNSLNLNALADFTERGKKVILVSPELHGFHHEIFWASLMTFLNENPSKTNLIGICTDYPEEAREYFLHENR